MQLALKLPRPARRISLDGILPVLVLFLFLKIGLGLLGVFIVTHYPTTSPIESATLLYRAIVPGGFQNGQALSDLTLWPWMRWDTEWYLRISMDGYQPGGSAAFAPIYPLLIRLLSFTGLHPISSALVISNLALVLCCLLLYRETQDRFGPQAAFRSVLYFLAFPSAVFLFAGYTEALFTMLALLAWRAGHRQRWLWMSIFGTLAVLTRFQGIGFVVPLAYIWWKQRKSAPLQGLFLLIIPAGLALWSLFVKFALRADFPWAALHKEFESFYAWPWYALWHSFSVLIGPKGCITDFMDFTLTMIFIILMVVAAFKLPGEYWMFMAAILVPSTVKVAFDMPLMSMSRYLLPLFPGFLILADLGRRRLFHFSWLIFSTALMAISAAGFFFWWWVA